MAIQVHTRSDTEPPASELSAWLRHLSRNAADSTDLAVLYSDDESLTWGELEHRVRTLCEGLTTAGIGPGARVAVYLDRQPEAVVAFLAILRLGAVYLPLDLATPAKRLTQMLEPLPDLRLVTSSDLEARLSALELGPIVVVDTQAKASSERSGLVADIADDLPAYVMFTSGSTGAPDGVVVSRRSLLRYSRALESSFHLERGDVCLHTAACSFSASIRQLLGPLTAGATLALASEEARHDPFLLLQRMRAWKVTVWDTVPSVWRIVEQVISTLAERDEATQVPESLRRIFLTGEPLSWDLVRAWRRHLHSGVEIRNLYSQTETAGTVSAFEVPQDCFDYDGSVPLGEPLPGVDLLLLDEQLNRVARGAEGEIFVASDRLADGYLHDDPSSRKRFLRNFTVGDRSYDRVYRTGDIARLGADGSLMPAGRRDHRVKIRGIRVDLGEVEAELERDGRIDQAVVTTEATEGGLQLVAHVIPAGKPAPSVEQIRDRLREHLPAYAVPGWIELESRFPRTPSGKIDRGALTDRRRRRSPSAPSPVAADDAIGSLLSIWQRLLGYRDAHPDDDFFAHGGDSLVAISLFLEIEQRFGVRLPPSTLFTTATVRGLASLLRREEPEAVSESVLTLQQGGNLPPLFLVHTLWEHLPHFRDLVALLDPELPVYALEPTRDHRDLSRDTDLKQLIESYVRDIREVCPGGPYFLAGWSIGGLMAYSVAVELEKAGDRPQRVLLIDSASPALRPQIRSAGGRGEFAWLRHGQRLVERQLRSFRLTPREQLERMRWVWREALRRMGGWIRRPPGFEVRERLKQEFRIIVDQFQPLPYAGGVTLFRSEQRVVDPSLEEDMGWGELVQDDFEIVRLPGDHVSIVIEPRNMRLLAEGITATMERSVARGRDRVRTRGDDRDEIIDRFLEQSLQLVGKPFTERLPWNNVATRDSIRQFAFGICDDNPLWTDPAYATAGPFGRLMAPPAYLVSARYPILHGAPMDAPLLSLLKDIEFSWYKRVFEGDELHSSTEQGEVREVVEPGGNRRIYVEGITTYSNSQEELVGRARGTVVRMPSQGEFRLEDWSPYEYQSEELERVQEQMLAEQRTGSGALPATDMKVGAKLPGIVRGPFNIGDMVCWHAAVGPSYRPGPLGYKDILETPQFRVLHPSTRWPIKYMLQHEDWNLAHQRGMPAPFDNGVMRFAWVSPLLTNWMGDRGFLARLKVTIHLPVLYGDTCWYSGEVVESSPEGDHTRVGVRILGTNQLGSIATSGYAEVVLPQDTGVDHLLEHVDQ